MNPATGGNKSIQDSTMKIEPTNGADTPMLRKNENVKKKTEKGKKIKIKIKKRTDHRLIV